MRRFDPVLRFPLHVDGYDYGLYMCCRKHGQRSTARFRKLTTALV